MGIVSHPSPLAHEEEDESREAPRLMLVYEIHRPSWLARLVTWLRPPRPTGPIPDAPFTFKPKPIRLQRPELPGIVISRDG